MKNQKNYVTSVRITATDKAFLTKHHLSLSDVLQWSIMQYERCSTEAPPQPCIYIRTQSRTTARPDCPIDRPDEAPRSTAPADKALQPDRAAPALLIEHGPARASLLNDCIRKGYAVSPARQISQG